MSPFNFSVSDTLPAHGIVVDLTDDERASLFAYGETVSHLKSDKLVEQGKPQGFLHLLLSGELRVVAASDQALLTLGYVQPGECVGEMTMLEPITEAAAHVVATVASTVWCLQREQFLGFVEEYPVAGAKMYRGIAVLLARRLRRRTEHLVESAG